MRHTWLGVLSGVALTAGGVFAQFGGPPGGGFGGPPGGGDSGRGNRGGFGGGAPDPNMIWQMMAQGDKPSINLNERPDIRERMQQRGTPIPPDGILTKEAFVISFQQRMAQGGGFGGPPGGGRGGPGGGFDPNNMTDDQVRQMMQRYDKNADGRITAEEAASSDRLKAAFTQYDKNADGAIDVAEYKLYMQDRFSNRGPQPGTDPNASASVPQQFSQPGGWQPQQNNRQPVEEEKEERPVVHRFGKLPKEIPSWFEKLDGDQDGQVGLYEWRQAERATTEFVEMDLNGDGYLTADEWLRYTKALYEKKPGDGDTTAADGSMTRGTGERGGPTADRGGNDRGRGGPPGGSRNNAGSDDRRQRGSGRNPFGGGGR